jgi:SOS-response transcriptional repressor LexA
MRAMVKNTENFTDRLNLAIEKAGYPRKGKGRLNAIGKLFDISGQAVARWLNGEVTPIKRINEISEKLKVNSTWLLTAQGNMNPLSNVISAPGAPVSQNDDLAAHNWQKVPLIKWSDSINWHTGTYKLSEETKYIWATTETNTPHFAVAIEDDSMQPRFYPGNILIFEPSLKPVHKNRVLVYWKKTGSVLCGVLLIHGPMMTLKPHNPDYKAVSLDNPDEFEFIAVCRQVFIIEN